MSNSTFLKSLYIAHLGHFPRRQKSSGSNTSLRTR